MEISEITNIIKDIITHSSISVGEVSITPEEKSVVKKDGNTRSLWFSVELNDPHFFISREGEGLSALNHLVKKILESKMGKNGESSDNLEMVIDINGFQKRKIENIHALAHMMAERARYFKSSIEIDPMPAFERRVIHEFLADAVDLKTESEGEGAKRRVIIKYIGSI